MRGRSRHRNGPSVSSGWYRVVSMGMRRDKEKMRGEAVLIGTSGWSYRHWKGPFYPGDLPAERYLPFYAGRFSTVEINSTFYPLPAGGARAPGRGGGPGRVCR